MDEREVQRMNARKKYRILVSALLVLSVMLTAGAGMAARKRQIPDHMTVRERGEAPVFFSGLIGNWIETKVEESMKRRIIHIDEGKCTGCGLCSQ